jgi:hypothetical protein
MLRSSTPSSSERWVLLAARSARTGDLPPRDAVAPGGWTDERGARKPLSVDALEGRA